MNSYGEILMKHITAENAHDMEGTLATLHPDCLFEEVPTGKIYRGLAGARQHYEYWWSVFDLKFERTIAQHWTVDGKLIAESKYSGVHQGEFLGVPRTNRKIEYSFLVTVSFRDGLLSGEKFYFDLQTILSQIR